MQVPGLAANREDSARRPPWKLRPDGGSWTPNWASRANASDGPRRNGTAIPIHPHGPVRQSPRPRCLGLAPPSETGYAKTWNHRPLEVAPRSAENELGRCVPCEVAPAPRSSRCFREPPSQWRYPSGVDSCCFAWPTSRNGEVSGASWANRDRRLPGNGKRARPRIAVWCRLGADIRTRTIPVHAKVRYGLTCLPEMTSNVEKKRSRKRYVFKPMRS